MANSSSASDLTTATILIFGASGDLTARKLIPALYDLWSEGFLSEELPIIGLARRSKTDEQFRNEQRESVAQFTRTGTVSDEKWATFSKRLYYREVDITDKSDHVSLKSTIETVERETVGDVISKRVAYLATAPSLFYPAVQALSRAEMIPRNTDDQWLRVVIEKPFGHDLTSAQKLSQELSELLSEDQIYRIDHYLGKETVQNILLFRLSNSIFEPLLNRNHVDHVQITVAESQGIEHGRGGYYDRSGALRDVLQNHVLQLLCLIAMEPPALFSGEEIRDEKLKVLKTLTPGTKGPISDWAVAGQYTAGQSQNQAVPGYREEERVPADSQRETFVAMEVLVENWRWEGVPFYLRTGKRLPERVSEIAIQFKHPPMNLFTTVECDGDICSMVERKPNELIFRIQPKESISMKFSTKRPGMQYQIQPVTMDFAFEDAYHTSLPEAYERLLMDVLRGDSTLFTRSDELEAAWKFVTPVLEQWEKPEHTPEPYYAGTWGPAGAINLLEKSKRRWRTPSTSKKL
ncbi:glucose-6-phosphate dehydrogenase [Gimesia maris]|uniref:glucose-6-phosphate dehydrogenase n=1 Tax=Gimesia maris TaxID=122 RepID=UPI0030D82A5A|tara:strand:+ start:14362 stop:15921 length:1560 start_codon:yes stop_codon:yes gene_type:complete